MENVCCASSEDEIPYQKQSPKNNKLSAVILIAGLLVLTVFTVWLVVTEESSLNKKQRKIQQNLLQSKQPAITIILPEQRAKDLVFPATVEVLEIKNDSCVVVTGPPEVVARIHAQAYGLHDE